MYFHCQKCPTSQRGPEPHLTASRRRSNHPTRPGLRCQWHQLSPVPTHHREQPTAGRSTRNGRCVQPPRVQHGTLDHRRRQRTRVPHSRPLGPRPVAPGLLDHRHRRAQWWSPRSGVVGVAANAGSHARGVDPCPFTDSRQQCPRTIGRIRAHQHRYRQTPPGQRLMFLPGLYRSPDRGSSSPHPGHPLGK